MTFQALHNLLIQQILQHVETGDSTVSSFARRAGISQPHLYMVLSGKRGFSWDFADRAAQSMGLRVEDLVSLAETISRPPRGKQP